jgi:hypothetical protein
MAGEPHFQKHNDGISLVCRYLVFSERVTDPADPAEGQAVMWMSDGTGSGDAGEIMLKVTTGGVTSVGNVTFNFGVAA